MQRIALIFLIVLLWNPNLKGQNFCSPSMSPPPNNPDGSGAAWYPYSQNPPTIITIFGYPSSNPNHISLSLHLGARQWKLNYLHVQLYYIYYLGINEGPDFTLLLDENTKTDQSNQIKFALTCDLRTCHNFGNRQCSYDVQNSPFGSITAFIEIPDWNRNTFPSSVCQSDHKLDLSSYLINTLSSKFGDRIGNAIYYVDGVQIQDQYLDPSLFSLGEHIITARKTYCNSNDWGSVGDFISPPIKLTISAPTIVFPNDNLFLCTSGKPTSLLASPVGGTWIDINNNSNPALVGNTFDPSKIGPGIYTLQYIYSDPSDPCIGKKNLKVIVNNSPAIIPGNDYVVESKSKPILLNNDLPSGGIYNGIPVQNNYFDPSKANLCDNFVTYTVTDPLTLCSTSIQKNVKVIPSIGTDFSICNFDTPYNLLNDVYPKGGQFSGDGVIGNNFDPQSLLPGQYIIDYSIINSNGCIAKNSRTITVLESPPNPRVSGVLNGCDGQVLSLLASSANSNPSIYQWYKLGIDTPFYIGQNLNYTINGTEILILKAVNQYGCVSSSLNQILINSNTPKGDFSSNVSTIPFGNLVNFKTNLIGNSYLWEFGDGGIAYNQNPSHYFYKEGVFDVKLICTSSEGCSTEIIKREFIHVLPQNRDSLTIIQPQINGIDSNSHSNTIFPSPFNTILKFSLGLNFSQQINVLLMDLEGRIIRSSIIQGKIGQNIYEINNLGNLPGGVFYILNINSKEIILKDKVLKL